MKTPDPTKPYLKSSKPTFKDSIKSFLSKKEGKILTVILSIILIFVLTISGYLVYKTKNNLVATKTPAEETTTLTANVDGLELGTPLTLVGENGARSSILNGQSAQVTPGKYTLQSLIDSEGGQVQGVKEELEVKNNEKKQVSLSLKSITIDESKAVARALSTPTETKQILNIKPVETKNSSIDNVDGSISSTSTGIKTIYPSLILPTLGNQDVAAIIQPNTAKYSLVDSSKVILPTQSGNSSNPNSNNSNQTTNNGNQGSASQPNTSNNSSNPTTGNGTNPNTAPSNISQENSSTLVAQTKDGQVTLAQGCEIAKVNFDNGGKILKYFKACDNGQNGFYQYDLATKIETQVLPTSDSSNQIKVDNSLSQDLMVWTKPEYGQFGIIQNGKSETILTNTYFTAPTFSPDGKYIIVMDNYLNNLSDQQIKDLKLSNSNEDQFGLRVKVVSAEDLIQNRDKADFKQVGTTYYIPRPIDYNFDFIYFKDATHFMAGDSSKIFSLSGEPEDIRLLSDQPGRIFETKNNLRYRLYQNTLFNSKNEPLISYVDKVYQLENQEFYFKVGDFLFRLVDDTPVQAYPKPISSVTTSDNTIELILTDGQVVKF